MARVSNFLGFGLGILEKKKKIERERESVLVLQMTQKSRFKTSQLGGKRIADTWQNLSNAEKSARADWVNRPSGWFQ